MPAIIVDVQLNPKTNRASVIRKTIDDMKDLRDVLKDNNDLMGRFNTLASRGGGGGGGGRGGSGGGRGGRGRPPVVGPDAMDMFRFYDKANRLSGGKFQGQRSHAYAMAMGHAQSTGNVKMMTQLMGQHNAKTPMHPAMKALMTSRFGMGGISPLVGQSVAAVESLGVAAGPAAVAIGGLALAAKMAQMAFETAQERGRLRVDMGPSSDAARRSWPGGNWEGAGNALRDKVVSGDPYATDIASRHGLSTDPGPLGEMDRAKYAIAMQKEIMASRSLDEARLKSFKGTGSMEYATEFWRNHRPGPNASESERMSYGTSRYEQVRAAQDQAMQDNNVSGMKGVLNDGWKYGPVISYIKGTLEGLWGQDQSKLSKATEANTKALNDNTNALSGPNGIRGAGTRGGGQLPSSLKGKDLTDSAIYALGSGMKL